MRPDSDRTQATGIASPVIRACLDSAGRRIAWSTSGVGSPSLVCVSGWMTHLNLDWTDGAIGSFYRGLAACRRLVRYDRPGLGLASREQADFSLEGELDMLAGVLAASTDGPVALLGRSLSGPVAMAFAALHPERVSHLVLFGTSARILEGPTFPEGVKPDLAHAIERLVAAEWGLGSRAITEIMLPGVTVAEARWYADYQRSAASPEVAARIIREHTTMDVTDLLGSISVPTLVMHRRDDRAIDAAGSRRLASAIPGATLRILEGSENLPFYGDSASVIAEIGAFLNPAGGPLTRRELAVLQEAAEGRSNAEIASALEIAPATVARHLANVYVKLEVATRVGAVTTARRSGLID